MLVNLPVRISSTFKIPSSSSITASLARCDSKSLTFTFCVPFCSNSGQYVATRSMHMAEPVAIVPFPVE
ncbi:unnamed protein product [Adineta steineri]|uniref:Uncharacterized protein n=1 Tax=Adineta steineri TaxID=433720 RepID=A0A814FNJ3_9BILA|nr:unnamed protein product [Adineta steineri]CAF3929714.1 unnamed protein product [Adineta steineri]